MHADDLRTWFRDLYPFLASDLNTERFVKLVTADVQAGVRVGMARISAVRTLADERWPRKGVQDGQ